MQNLVRYRAMESLCRQGAVFHPLESWRLLAQAEMWHHKAQDEMAASTLEPRVAPPLTAAVGAASQRNAREASSASGHRGAR
jgi:hypothetical protein